MRRDWLDFYCSWHRPLCLTFFSLRLRFTLDIWPSPAMWMLRYGTDAEDGWLCIGPFDLAWGRR